jgi:hypothetical protein
LNRSSKLVAGLVPAGHPHPLAGLRDKEKLMRRRS